MFAAQDALFALLQTAAAGWATTEGLPARFADKQAWVDENVDEWVIDPEHTGDTDESFTLNVYFFHRRTAAKATAIRAEINTPAAAFAAALKEDPTLSGAVSQATIVGGQYEGAFDDQKATVRVGALHVRVGCRTW